MKELRITLQYVIMSARTTHTHTHMLGRATIVWSFAFSSSHGVVSSAMPTLKLSAKLAVNCNGRGRNVNKKA